MRKVLIYLSYASSVLASDRFPLPPISNDKKIRDPQALYIAAARDALQVTANRIELNKNMKDDEAQKEVEKIKKYLAIVPFNDVCVESLTKIVCAFAKKGCAFEVLQLFVVIKQCENNPECIRKIAGEALLTIKKQELLSKRFFCGDSFNPVPDPDGKRARTRVILEQQFKDAEKRMIKK